jgi:hypothetical protein
MDGEQNMRRTEYLSFLLRLWRVSAEGAPAWRISLQRPGAAGGISFADLDAVVAFLRAEMGEGVEPEPSDLGVLVRR